MIESMDLNNKIIITTEEQKESVLKKINGMELLNVKVLTIDEVRKKFYFDYPFKLSPWGAYAASGEMV